MARSAARRPRHAARPASGLALVAQDLESPRAFLLERQPRRARATAAGCAATASTSARNGSSISSTTRGCCRRSRSTAESRRPATRCSSRPASTRSATSPCSLGCAFNSRGTVKTGTLSDTNVPRVFVAGDASRDAQFVVVAAAEGVKAAVAINQALQKPRSCRDAQARGPERAGAGGSEPRTPKPPSPSRMPLRHPQRRADRAGGSRGSS